MGLAEKLQEFAREEYAFELPDGETLTLRPVKAIEIIPRLGVAPSVVGEFLAQGQVNGEVLDPEKIPEAAVIASRLEEAYLVYGIAGPVKLRFTHEEPDPETIDVTTFRNFVRKRYGEEVLADLERRIREISGEIAPEEVAQDRASFRAVAPGAALPGEDVRDEPDRAPEASAG